jgi:hypothetical protein
MLTRIRVIALLGLARVVGLMAAASRHTLAHPISVLPFALVASPTPIAAFHAKRGINWIRHPQVRRTSFNAGSRRMLPLAVVLIWLISVAIETPTPRKIEDKTGKAT